MVYLQVNLEGNDLHAPQGRPFSIVEMLSTVLRQWRLILLLPLAIGAVVGGLNLRLDRTYKASASFMPQTPEGRTVGGAAALAQQLGMSLGNEISGPGPQFYVEVLRSRSILRQVVESEFEVRASDGRLRRATLIHFYGIEEAPDLPPPWRRGVDRLRRSLSTSVSGTGVVQLTVTAPEPDLAEKVAERMLELLNEFNMGVRQTRAQEETRFIGSRVQAAHDELRAAEDAVQSFLDRSPQFRNSPGLLFEFERLQRQLAIRQDVYTALLQAHEQNRIDAIRDTPVLALLDHPAGTAEPQSRGTLIRTLLAVMFGLAVSILIALVRELFRRSREGDPHYQELQTVAHEAWREMRSPTRWIGVAQK